VILYLSWRLLFLLSLCEHSNTRKKCSVRFQQRLFTHLIRRCNPCLHLQCDQIENVEQLQGAAGLDGVP